MWTIMKRKMKKSVVFRAGRLGVIYLCTFSFLIMLNIFIIKKIEDVKMKPSISGHCGKALYEKNHKYVVKIQKTKF